jgi:hypothetical protein
MTFLPALPRLTEKRWMAQLVSTSETAPGLLRLLGFERIWHDRATNAPRACPHCHAPLDLPRNDPGFPDLVAIRGEELWLVELKTDRGRPTAEQIGWLRAISGVRRVRWAIWRPRDVDAIVADLRRGWTHR